MSFPPLEVIAERLGGEVSGGQVLAPGPGHSSRDRSMCVKLVRDAPDGFIVHSFSTDDPLACKDYVRERLGIRHEARNGHAPSTPIINMQQRASQSERKPRSRIIAEYVYRQEDGAPYLKVQRTENKDFPQLHWTGSDWAYGAPKGPKIPYLLPQLVRATHDTAFIVEGEKDADTLAARGFIATTSSEGAGKWRPELNRHFAHRRVFILPDNDDAGRKHAQDVAAHLHGIASEIRILELPGLPPRGDVSGWIDAGGDTGKLVEMCEAAPAWTPEQSTEHSSEQKSEQTGEKTDSGLILSSAEFVAGFVPPDYLIDGLLQKRFCYSITAPTGHGKTALLLLVSASVGEGWSIGEYPVEKGRVLYLAGENPDDVRMRWIAMGDSLGFDIETIDVHFLAGAKKLSEIGDRIRAELERIGAVDLVIVDTSAAYGEYDEENANKQMGDHARRMRALTTLPGAPCVLVACHPVKNASQDNLLPRGGGAFTAEVDGNLTLWKGDGVATLHWQGKFRGPDFPPIPFSLIGGTTERLRDSKGRLIPSVYAKALSEKERSEAAAGSRGDEDALLVALLNNERASYAILAAALGWSLTNGKPNTAKVQRAAKRLMKDKLAKMERDRLTLTEKGNKEAKQAKYNADAAGASYG